MVRVWCVLQCLRIIAKEYVNIVQVRCVEASWYRLGGFLCIDSPLISSARCLFIPSLRCLVCGGWPCSDHSGADGEHSLVMKDPLLHLYLDTAMRQMHGHLPLVKGTTEGLLAVKTF